MSIDNRPIRRQSRCVSIQQIHDASATILEKVGIEFRDDEALSYWRKAGAVVRDQRARIGRAHLMELIGSAPSHYTMHARKPERSVTLGDSNFIEGRVALSVRPEHVQAAPTAVRLMRTRPDTRAAPETARHDPG